MANILKRFGDIMASNFNEWLDKLEDPAKMCKQYLRQAKESLSEVKGETAGVMAEEKRCRRVRDDLKADVEKYMGLAQKAVAAGNDDDARTFLAKKNELAGQLATAEAAWQTAKLNADQMIQMHDKLVEEIEKMEARQANVEATVAAAKAQEKINEFHAKFASPESGAAFDSMAEKAKARLDAAQAKAELDGRAVKDEAADLAAKYAGAGDQSIDDELAALKAAMAGDTPGGDQ